MLILALQSGEAEGAIFDENSTTCSCANLWLLGGLLLGGIHVVWVWWPTLSGAARRLYACLSSSGVVAGTATTSCTSGYTTTRLCAVPGDSDDLDDDSHWSDTDLEADVCYFAKYGTKFHTDLRCGQLRDSVGLRRLERCSVCGSKPLGPFQGWDRGLRPRGRAKVTPSP